MQRVRTFSLLWGLVTSTISQSIPKFGINIAPIYNESSVSLFNVTICLESSVARANATLLSLNSQARYENSTSIVAADDSGTLTLAVNDTENGTRSWILPRDTIGNVVVNFIAEPFGDVFGVWGRSELRYDQGGALGQGGKFIPYPPGENDWNVTVHWEIPDDAPEDTRFVTSFGDIQDSYDIGSPSKVLINAVFAVGNINRWPDWDEDDTIDEKAGVTGRKFAMYWLGNLPWDSTLLAAKTKQIYIGTSKYFDDDESDFRVFYRHDIAATGGVGCYKAFLMEYADGAELETPAEALASVISHEIIHGFALLYPYLEYDKWYLEGVAEYLKSVAPYTGGTLDRKTFVKWLNDNAIDYYTASPLGRTWKSIIENYWGGGLSSIKAPYTRGFVYLAYAQGLIAEATDHKRGIDDVILALYKMFINGENLHTQEFIDLLGNIIGKESAQASFDAMANGTTLIPFSEGFKNYGLRMVRRDHEAFELGFTIGPNGVEVVPGSRAEQAGLRSGERIASRWGEWIATDSLENMMQIVVLRDGKEETIRYWPRSHEKVESWEWIDVLRDE